MAQELPFDPYPFLSDPHRQTILGAFLNFTEEPRSVQKLVVLPDGDKISLEITTPKGWKETDLTVFFVHGLCGSHQSPILIRMASRLEALGIRSIRFNMRECGSGEGHASKLFHCGGTEDVFECLKVLKREMPDSEIILIGYSLGANISLKLVGELGSMVHPFLKAVVAVSPPVELNITRLKINLPENRLYYNYFARAIVSKLGSIYSRCKDLPPLRLPSKLTLDALDELYTVPLHGFENAVDYYNKCSSIHYVDEIVIPCRILFAKDDPIVPHDLLDQHKLPANVNIYKTQKGGHLGFIGSSDEHEGIFWLDSLVTQWILEFNC